MKKYLLYLFIVFAFLTATVCSRSGPSEESEKAAVKSITEIEERIARVESKIPPGLVIKGEEVAYSSFTELMEKHQVPGLSLAVINDGEVEWAKGYGVLEEESNKEVNENTLFQAASISKPVAAMAGLALVETGTLDLDTNINDFLTSWKLPENEFTQEKKVTLRLLLSHTAGVTVNGFPGYATGKEVALLVQVLDGKPPANTKPIRVDILPESKWRYSGGGFCIAQQAMVDVMGKDFPAVMRETVLSPLGMKNSTYNQPLSQEMLINATAAHNRTGKVISGKRHIYPEMAAAGLWTTAGDLARFAVEIQKSLKERSNKVLSREMTEKMLTEVKGSYGLGLSLGGDLKNKTFSHGGSNAGFRCSLFAYVERGQGAVLMTNSDKGSSLFAPILRSIAAE